MTLSSLKAFVYSLHLKNQSHMTNEVRVRLNEEEPSMRTFSRQLTECLPLNPTTRHHGGISHPRMTHEGLLRMDGKDALFLWQLTREEAWQVIHLKALKTVH